MAQDRLISVIRQFRRTMGDEILRIGQVGSPGFITDYITQNGETWSAEEIKDLAVRASNAIVNTIYTTLQGRKSLDNLARIVPEFVQTKTWGTGQVTNQESWNEWPLPDDFGWILSARYAPGVINTGERSWYSVDLDRSFHASGYIANDENLEERKSLSGFIQGSTLVIVPGSEWVSQDHLCRASMTYVRIQQDITLGSNDDLLIRPKYDLELLTMMKRQAELYKGESR